MSLESKEIYPVNRLTNRELEVLRKLAEFKDNITISLDLKISLSAVKVHISSILEKLNVYNRFQAVIAAVKIGILELDDIKIIPRIEF